MRVRLLGHRRDQPRLEVRRHGGVPLSRTDLTNQPAGPALGDLEPALKMDHGCPAPDRAHQFPRCRSFNMLMSKACSATISFSRAFSNSNAFNRCASSSFSAPYFVRHR
jgi:hypothetical protein